jgi:tetratricopeptide (TPR) repeat protein
MAAIPARYALERHAWAEAFALEPHPTNLPYAEAITHFGRALGFARSGRAAAASKDIDALASIRDRLVKAKDAYWTEQVDIQRQVAVAWVALADGRSADAVALLRAAADREDATEKAATMPGPLMPARELLGDMLMELKQPDRALTEYESSNTKEPNRFWGVYGAARAAELLGQRDQARRYYQQLLTICRRADRPLRPELQKGESVVKASAAARE